MFLKKRHIFFDQIRRRAATVLFLVMFVMVLSFLSVSFFAYQQEQTLQILSEHLDLNIAQVSQPHLSASDRWFKIIKMVGGIAACDLTTVIEEENSSQFSGVCRDFQSIRKLIDSSHQLLPYFVVKNEIHYDLLKGWQFSVLHGQVD
jgi:hypothetical protein